MQDKPRPTEVYITCCDADMHHAGELTRALGRRARIAVRGGDVGADAVAETGRCIHEAGLFAVLLSRASSLDAGLRGEVTAIVNQVCRDPSRKVVPIHLDEASWREPDALPGLGRFHALRVEAPGAIAAVADSLASVVRVHLRLAQEIGAIDERQLVFLTGELDAIGRQIGGWQRRLAQGMSGERHR